jgi:hypothetical protein
VRYFLRRWFHVRFISLPNYLVLVSVTLRDRRFTTNHFVLATSPLRLTTSNFFFQLNTCGYSSYVASDERMGLSFAIAADTRKRSHSQVRVPRDSWQHFTVSDSILPQLGWPGPRIYILQENGGPVIPPGIRLPFHRFLRLAWLHGVLHF